MTIPDNMAILMARALCGEASPEEMAELSLFADVNPEVSEGMETLEKLFQKRATNAAYPGIENRARRQKLHHIIQKAREAERLEAAHTLSAVKRIPRVSFFKYAAIFLLVATGVLVVWRQTRQGRSGTAAAIHTISAAPGSRTRTMLPDGTKVWLNAGSTISYTASFNTTAREVMLGGEAFFDVTKNPRLPFVVHIGKMDIRVLGTSFNVKLYEGDANMEATLISGAIEVSTGKGDAPAIRMTPHQKLIIPLISSHHTGFEQVPGDSIQSARKTGFHLVEVGMMAAEETLPETAWIYNRLVFKNESFELLANKLRRWYGVEILFDDEAVKALMFTGSFENETIDQAMLALQKVSPFTIKKIANEIHILSEK